MTQEEIDNIVQSACAKVALVYNPNVFDDPSSFRVKFFTDMASEGRVCSERGPGDPSVGITSESCEPDLEEIQVESCGCATARYWCRHGHHWIELQCVDHAARSIDDEMDQWDARR